MACLANFLCTWTTGDELIICQNLLNVVLLFLGLLGFLHPEYESKAEAKHPNMA
jgi:hypothetical protein